MRYLPVAAATVVVAGVSSGIQGWPGPRAALVAAVAALVAALAAWRRDWPRLVVGGGLAGLAAAGAALGASAGQALRTPPLAVALAEAAGVPADTLTAGGGIEARLQGRLAGDAAIDEAGRAVFTLRVTRLGAGPCGCAVTAAGDVRVTVAGTEARGRVDHWRGGRAVTLTATVRMPVPRRNPGDLALLRLARRRVALAASVKSAWLVEVTARGSWPEELASAVRARARAALAAAAGPGSEAAAIATAVLIGDRAGLSSAVEDRLQRAGTFHVIAISGGNIAVWTLLTLGAASRLTRHRQAGLGAAAATLVAYAGVVGGGASVVRATGMALVGIACQAADLRGAGINVLALTAAAMVAAAPGQVVDIGFWLTLAATAGIVAGMPPPGGGSVRRWVRALVLTSVWAEAALLPIGASVFQQVSVAGVLLSAVAVPAMAVAQVAALAAVAIHGVVAPLVWLPGAVLRWSVGAVTGSAALVDVWPWLAWHVPPPAAATVVAYYGALAAWRWARRGPVEQRRMLVCRLTAVAAPVLAGWVALDPPSLVSRTPGRLRLVAFDVGQGDALLVQLPNGRTLLVDTGGASAAGRDIGGRLVGAALRSLRVRRLDYLVVTHADLDHLGGAARLVREFRPGEVWVGVAVAEHPPSEALRDAADGVGAGWREVRAGERLWLGEVVVDVRHPPVPDWQRLDPRNDDSVVLDVRWRGARALLTGDVGAGSEQVLSRVVGAEPAAPVTVLKVAHHGSAGSTSDAWLRAVGPAVAIISAGAGNPFGHPAPAVLARLQAAGADVWRTDRDGAIVVDTDGHTAVVTAMSGRTRRIGGPAPDPQPR
jgi:competence protein ComEC